MGRALRACLAVVIAFSAGTVGAQIARADVSNSTGTNIQDGSNRSTTTQGGTGKSGDAVGGQVTGVVSSGRTSVDARNTSSNSDVTSGDARASNSASSFTGLSVSGDETQVGGADITNSGCSRDQGCNLQDGSNRLTQNQTANASTGDGVAGEVIGVVSSGGTASIVAANKTDNSSAETGEARADNTSNAFVGEVLTRDGPDVGATDITGNICNRNQGCNIQDGANRGTFGQTANSTSGDGVVGQVIGGVSAGALSIDASNTTTDSDVTSGDARTSNDADAFVGLDVSREGPEISDLVNDGCNRDQGCNLQDGNNSTSAHQTASATTGDGVAGEVIGAVTSAGGSASIVAANTTSDSSADTGDADASNDLGSFTGLVLTREGPFIADITNSGCDENQGCNLQDGNNRTTASQSATAATGDGVAGQVLGVVSAGAASLDATNHTSDSDVTTGNSDASNDAALFVGLTVSRGGPDIGLVGIDDVSDSGCFDNRLGCNVQDGNNTKTLSQNANATSGDGVAGQVSGVVTSAGGSASVVLANTSTDISADSGESNFSNDAADFVGQNLSRESLTIF
jgi:hypothetical protein